MGNYLCFCFNHVFCFLYLSLTSGGVLTLFVAHLPALTVRERLGCEQAFHRHTNHLLYVAFTFQVAIYLL